MTPEIAKTILQFMSRAQLSGAEAPVFLECCAVLRAIAVKPEEKLPEAK